MKGCPLSVKTMDELLTYATKKLNLAWAARRVFELDGREVHGDDDLRHGMDVVVTAGEDFRHRQGQRGQRTYGGHYHMPSYNTPTLSGGTGVSGVVPMGHRP